MWFTGGGGRQSAQVSLQMLALAGIVAGLLVGCPADDEMTTDCPEGDMPIYKRVACPADLPEMRIGMRAQGLNGLVRGELIDADAIPVVQYHNAWTVAFTGPDGEAMSDVELVRAQTFMPAHLHDGRHEPVLDEPDAKGNYRVEELNIWMEGPWEVRFFVDTPEGEDTVIFEVCLLQERTEAGVTEHDSCGTR